MRIAIVNDLTIAISALRSILRTVPDYQVIWTATDGTQAVSKCAQEPPDLILMDLLMPIMDGVEATRQIMEKSPCGILLVTASTRQNLPKVYEAMGYGALDAIDIPILDCPDSAERVSKFLARIATIRTLLKGSSAAKSCGRSLQRVRRDCAERSAGGDRSVVPLVAIGSSTGGPKVLATILSQLPTDFEAAIAIVQHVNAHFSAGLIEWLNQQSRLPVRAAVAGDRLERGRVLVAGTNDHLYFKADFTLDYTQDPIDYPYRPSIDVFFKSLAQHSRKGTAILLTGMGRDGAEGLCALRLRGWHTIAQDKESCAVYGMPRAAVELNAAVEVLSPAAIATALIQN